MAKAAIMAAKHEERVVTVLKSLSSDGLILPEEDRENLEAFIQDFFGNNDDNTESENEQVFPVSSKAQLHVSALYPIEFLGRL